MSKAVAQDVHEVLAGDLDAHAKSFGLRLDKRTRHLIASYLTACTAKFVSILVVLAAHCNKPAIELKDIHDLKKLSTLFLSVDTVKTKKHRSGQSSQSSQSGGAELPPGYFGADDSSAYSANPSYHTAMPDAAFVRPALPMSFDMLGGAAIAEIHRPAFLNILAKKEVPAHPPLKEDAENALRFIVNCNLLNIFTKIKTERRKTSHVRGSPVSSRAVKSAIAASSFVIPI